MTAAGSGVVVMRLALVSLALAASAPALAADPAVEPEATRILKRMTDYLAGLERFSMDTDNMIEDVLVSGQKIQYDFTSTVIVERPDKVRAERTGDLLGQLMIYDGKTFSIYEPAANYYAITEVPDTIDATLHFLRDRLDIIPPSGDFVFSNAFELLTSAVTSGVVVGKSIVRGIRCDHLAFTSPLVDWQVWIADGDRPLPHKYVLTTRDDPAEPSYILCVSNWNTSPRVKESTFRFTPPGGAKEVQFLRNDRPADR